MPRNAPILTYNADGDLENPDEQPPLVDPDQQKAFDDLKSGSTATDAERQVWVYKVPTDRNGVPISKARMGQMFTCSVDQYTLDELLTHVRDDWMGTDTRWAIRVQVREQNGSVILNKLFDLYKNQNAPNAGPTRTQSDSSSLISDIRVMLTEQEQRFNERLAHVARLSAEKTPASDAIKPMDMITFMANQQQQSMQTLVALLTVMKPDSTGSKGLGETLDSMMKMQEFARGLNPGPEGDSALSTVKALAPFAPLLKSMIDKGKEAGAAVPALLAAPVPNPAPAQPNAPTTPTTPTTQAPAAVKPVQQMVPMPAEDETKRSDMLNQLREQLKSLADIAPQAPDAKEVVAMLLPMLPPEMDDLIFDTLQSDAWFTRLCFIQPAIKPYEAWFADVRQEILASFDVTPAVENSGEPTK